MPDCPFCNGMGYHRPKGWNADLGPGDPLFGKLVRCQCMIQQDSTRYQRELGAWLDREMHLGKIITEGRPGTKAMVSAARQFVMNPTGWLTIWGNNGTGKTMTLQGITNELLKAGKMAVYVNTVDAVEYMKSGIGNTNFDLDARVHVLSTLFVLCLDELSAVRWTEWVIEQLGNVLNKRYTANMPTVLAMDTDPLQIMEPRIVSRMQEGKIVHNNDSDLRNAMQQLMEQPNA